MILQFVEIFFIFLGLTLFYDKVNSLRTARIGLCISVFVPLHRDGGVLVLLAGQVALRDLRVPVDRVLVRGSAYVGLA